MRKQLDYCQAVYGPQQFKNFPGALGAFLAQECPQLGGVRTRQVLVQAILDMIGKFYPATSHLRQGQIQWTTIHKDEKASYGKSIPQCQLTTVVLDLVQPQDAEDRANGMKLRELKIAATARLFNQAYEQSGCLTNAEVALMLKTTPVTVSKYIQEWQAQNDQQLPRRGTIHDMGPTLTHKKIIVQKLLLEGKSVEMVCRETCHSPEAVHRYITNFKQVLLCQRQGLSVEQTAFAVKMSARLVGEYHQLIAEFAQQNQKLDELINKMEISKN